MAEAQEHDEFETAFADFASKGEGGDVPPVDPAPLADSGDNPPEPAPVGDVEPAPAAEPAPAPTEPAPEPELELEPAPVPAEDNQATDDLINRLADLVKERPTPTPAQAPQATPEPEVDLYNPDEREFLAKYAEDWGDVARGEELRRRGEYSRLISYVFEQVAKEFQPLISRVQQISDADHYNDLRSRVDDYDTVRDKVVGWVGQQPAYLQRAYNAVIQQGTPEEVADLIGRYKQANGVTPEPAKAVELSDATKKAVEALAPVTTKRSTMPQTEDLSDYGAAFEAWASKGKL